MINLDSREQAARLMFSLLDPLKPYYSPLMARLKLGDTSAHYPDSAAWMEGFSRPLWGLGSYWGSGSEDSEWEDIYIRGLTAGTDPDGSEYWGDCVPFDQKLVEMAAIAFTLLWTKDRLLSRMTDAERDNLFAWLRQINSNPCCNCNWRFFHVLVNVALKKAGADYDREGMEDSLCYLDDCYAGDGWYQDGVGGMADYYIPFGMHFYGIVYAMFMKEEDPDRCRRFLDRAMRFGQDFVYWFAEDGAGIPYGRSMTYRFAQASFFSACIMAHIEPLPLGVMKGIIQRHLEYWMSKPIFDHGHVLTIGYCYPNLHMAETYNAPGSPYWAMKLFTLLTLPEDDPFWSVPAEPLPPLDGLKCLKAANMLIQRMPDGHAVMLPAGLQIGHVHAHMEEKYSKFAYSTRYGFSVSVSSVNVSEAAPDSVLCFEMDGHIFSRRTIDSFDVQPDRIVTEWSPFAGIRVRSEIIPVSGGHRRIHTIDSDYDCIAYDSGFAEPVEENSCTAECLRGKGEPTVIYPAPNTNLVCPKTKIPSVKYTVCKGRTVIESEFGC